MKRNGESLGGKKKVTEWFNFNSNNEEVGM